MSSGDPVQVERGFRKLYPSFGLKVLAGVGVLALIDLLPFPSKWWTIPFLLVGAWLVLVNLSAFSAGHGPSSLPSWTGG